MRITRFYTQLDDFYRPFKFKYGMRNLTGDSDAAFADLEAKGYIRRPIVPTECQHNAHMYYLLLPDIEKRTAFINKMSEQGIGTVFHYVPLHDSPIGNQVGKASGYLRHTESWQQVNNSVKTFFHTT